MNGTTEVIEAAWADRQERLRGVLKLIRLVVHATRQHDERMAVQGGVSALQVRVLGELARQPGYRVVDLARALSLHAKTIRQPLADLEARGLVTSTAVGYRLTEAGQSKLCGIDPPHRGLLFSALGELDEGELQALTSALARLAGKLPHADPGMAFVPLSAARATGPTHQGDPT